MAKDKQYNKICSRCGRRFETCYKHAKICEYCKKPNWGKKRKI